MPIEIFYSLLKSHKRDDADGYSDCSIVYTKKVNKLHRLRRSVSPRYSLGLHFTPRVYEFVFAFHICRLNYLKQLLYHSCHRDSSLNDYLAEKHLLQSIQIWYTQCWQQSNWINDEHRKAKEHKTENEKVSVQLEKIYIYIDCFRFSYWTKSAYNLNSWGNDTQPVKIYKGSLK